MIVWRSILVLAFLVCDGFFIIYGMSEGIYSLDGMNDVFTIEDKSDVYVLIVNVSDVTICDFPLLEGFWVLFELKLDEGMLKKVTKECFKDASTLYVLVAANQDIDEFDLDIKVASHLRRLELNGNSFKKFDLENKTFTNLKLLELSKNSLTKFVFRSIQAPNLLHIRLAENKIEEFDIKGYNLILLDLKNNRIKTFEGSRLIAPKLRTLHLSFNNLTQLTTNMIKDFPELTLASFNKNPIHLIDLSFWNISSLSCKNEEIIIDFPRREITIGVSWDSVRELNFSTNKITHLTIFNMEFELKVEELIMRDNLISEIGQDDLGLLGDLIMIDLSNNIISSIDENAFQNNTKLHTILLRGNKLKLIENSFLDNFKSIVSIDLRQNQINMFPLPGWDESTQETSLKSFDKIFLKEVLLQGNPLSCSNKNLLREWMSLHNHFVFHIDLSENCLNFGVKNIYYIL